jgi:hypothetical protein
MMMSTNLEKCVTLPDIQANVGKRVLVVGIYRQLDIRMRPKGIPEYVGHAAIQLLDGHDVLLEPSWSPAARRIPSERTRFEGQQVEVIGTLHLKPPEPPEPIAYVIAPCISPVEQIFLAGQVSS